MRMPDEIAARRAARLACRSERLVWAVRKDLRAVFMARVVDSRVVRALWADVIRERDECCSWTRAEIWAESFLQTDRASWIQSSRLERRIRASKEDVGCDSGGKPPEGLETLVPGSSKGRSVKLV